MAPLRKLTPGFLLALVATAAYGTDYFVAPTGNDANAGSAAQPFHTIQAAANQAFAGDTVFIKAGIYAENVVFPHSGASGAEITFRNFAQDNVVIDGATVSSGSWQGLLDLSGRSWIRLSGLRIQNSPKAGIYAWNGHHLTIENNHTHDTFSSGIGIWASTYVTVNGNEVSLACNNGGEESITIAGSGYCTVSNNHVHHNGPGAEGGEGIDVKDGSHHVEVVGNRVDHLNHRPGIYIDAWDKLTHDIEVHNNQVEYCSEAGISTASEMGGRLKNVSIFNNIIHHNLYGGIEVGGWLNVLANNDGRPTPAENVTIINNTVYGNGEGLNISNAYAVNLVVRNNIFSHDGGAEMVMEPAPADAPTIDHNLVDACSGVASNFCGVAAVVGDPLLVNPEANNFRVAAKSPAIDAGSGVLAPADDFSGVRRPKGSAVDIGAYEFGGAGRIIPTLNLLLD